MIKNLNEYVVKFSKVIPTKVCKKSVSELKKQKNWETHTFYNNIHQVTEKRSGDQELSTKYLLLSTNKILTDITDKAIYEYIKLLNMPWFNSWKHYTPLRYNKYSSKNKSKMAEHCDHIHSIFDGKYKGIPILSIVGNLNQNYKGGDFIMFNDTKITLEEGDILIFPSSFLYPHKVDPVIKGERYSFVSWAF